MKTCNCRNGSYKCFQKAFHCRCKEPKKKPLKVVPQQNDPENPKNCPDMQPKKGSKCSGYAACKYNPVRCCNNGKYSYMNTCVCARGNVRCFKKLSACPANCDDITDEYNEINPVTLSPVFSTPPQADPDNEDVCPMTDEGIGNLVCGEEITCRYNPFQCCPQDDYTFLKSCTCTRDGDGYRCATAAVRCGPCSTTATKAFLRKKKTEVTDDFLAE